MQPKRPLELAEPPREWAHAQFLEAQVLTLESTIVVYEDAKMEADTRRLVRVTSPVRVVWERDTVVRLEPMVDAAHKTECIRALVEGGIRLVRNRVVSRAGHESDAALLFPPKDDIAAALQLGDDHAQPPSTVASDAVRHEDGYHPRPDRERLAALERLTQSVLEYAREHNIGKTEMADIMRAYPGYVTSLLELMLPTKGSPPDHAFRCTFDASDPDYNGVGWCMWRLVPPLRLLESAHFPRDTCNIAHRLFYPGGGGGAGAGGGGSVCVFYESIVWPRATLREQLQLLFRRALSEWAAREGQHLYTVAPDTYGAALATCATFVHRDVCALVFEYAAVRVASEPEIGAMLRCTRQKSSASCTLDEDETFIQFASQRARNTAYGLMGARSTASITTAASQLRRGIL